MLFDTKPTGKPFSFLSSPYTPQVQRLKRHKATAKTKLNLQAKDPRMMKINSFFIPGTPGPNKKTYSAFILCSRCFTILFGGLCQTANKVYN